MDEYLSFGPLPLVLLNEAMSDRPTPPLQLFFFEDLPEMVRSQLAEWGLPNDTMFLFVSRPEAVASVAPVITAGRAIRCETTHQFGTIGPLLTTLQQANTAAFLTAGHLFSYGNGSTVQFVEPIWPRWMRQPRYRTIGRVVAHSSPFSSNGPAYDGAIVQLANPAALQKTPFGGVALLPPHHGVPLPGTVYGSVNGTLRNAGIVGTLNSYGNRQTIWKNAWILVATDVISHGDSGSAFVLDVGNNIAGMVVGASRNKSKSSKFLLQYAQDMAWLENDFLRPAGYRIL
jgi:hypothetical protein